MIRFFFWLNLNFKGIILVIMAFKIAQQGYITVTNLNLLLHNQPVHQQKNLNQLIIILHMKQNVIVIVKYFYNL